MKLFGLFIAGIVAISSAYLVYDKNTPKLDRILVSGPVETSRDFEISERAYIGYLNKQNTMEEVAKVVILIHKTHNPDAFEAEVGNTDLEKAVHLITAWTVSSKAMAIDPRVPEIELAHNRFEEVLSDYKRIAGREYKEFPIGFKR